MQERSHTLPSDVKQTIYSYGGYRFMTPTLDKAGFTLSPKPYPLKKSIYNSKVIDDLHSIWDIKKLNIPRLPVIIGKVTDIQGFCTPSVRILDMPIKLAGSNNYKIPTALQPFLSTIETIINHEHSILCERKLIKYNAYLTIDQSYVKAGNSQRKPGAHVDGFQGARIYPKTIINHSYIVSNETPTVFYPHAFNFSNLDERIHDFFLEMDKQLREEKAVFSQPYHIYLMDAFTVHRASFATNNCFRTFLRISYDVKQFDRLGNTHNPLLSYQWEMLPREVQTTLIPYEPLIISEEKLINKAEPNALVSYMNELRQLNLIHYCNFIYEGLKLNNMDRVKLIVSHLNSASRLSLHELRLLFIATTLNNLEVALNAKAMLINHLKSATRYLQNNLLLDFLLEIIQQKPYLIRKEVLIELIKSHEHTTQGAQILQALRLFNKTAPLNMHLWHDKSTVKSETDVYSGILKAKL